MTDYVLKTREQRSTADDVERCNELTDIQSNEFCFWNRLTVILDLDILEK